MALTEPPPRDSWRYCLRKFAEHDPEIVERVSCYDESTETYDITHADGKRRRTIFISSADARSRLLKMGWEDVTDQIDGKETISPSSSASPSTSSTATDRKRKPPARAGVVARIEG